MSRNVVQIKRLIDTALFFVFCALVGTGLGMEFRLGRNELHFPLSVALIVLIIIHISYNRKWIMSVIAGDNKKKMIGGVVAGLVIILLFMFAPMTEKKIKKYLSSNSQSQTSNAKDSASQKICNTFIWHKALYCRAEHDQQTI